MVGARSEAPLPGQVVLRLALLRVRSPDRTYTAAAPLDLGVPRGVDAYLHWSPFLLLSASATTPGRHFATGHSCHSPVNGSRIFTSPGPAQRAMLSRSGCPSGVRERNLSSVGLNSIRATL